MEEERTVEAMIVPSKKSFALTKVKLLKDGGLDVQYEVVETSGAESYVNRYHVESARDVHPDLRDCFDRLRPIMGRVFNVTSFLSMVEGGDFMGTEAQKAAARNFADECLKCIDVRGVSFSGTGDNVGVVICGMFTVSNNQKSVINSPRLRFDPMSFGFEEELEEIASDIESEVYDFLFRGKQAQLELFGANGEPNLIDEDDPDIE